MLTHEATGWQVDPDTGLVYGVGRKHKGKRIGTVNKRGYMTSKHEGRDWLLHRVVWETVHGREQPPRTQINHDNGRKTDNRPSNLLLTDAGGNLLHAYATGLRPRRQAQRGEGHGCHKLTAAQVATIRSATESGPVLAQRYGVDRSTINRIRRGRLWRDELVYSGAQ